MVPDARAQPAEEGEEVAPHAGDVRDRLGRVLPPLRPTQMEWVTLGYLDGSMYVAGNESMLTGT